MDNDLNDCKYFIENVLILALISRLIFILTQS